MNVLRWICALLLLAEFIMAPINLWTEHTMPNFIKFTGFSPLIAKTVFAPIKLLGALLILLGFWVPKAGAIGALILGSICLIYLIRLSAPKRRDAAGFGAFAFGLVCAAVVFAAEWPL